MEKELLEMILTAQVLTLAKQLKAEKAAKGIHTTGDMVLDAMMLIKNSRDQVLASMR